MKREFKQQRSLFIRNMVAFGLLFLLLGLIITQVLQQSLYKDVDAKLEMAATNESYLVSELQQITMNPPADKGFREAPTPPQKQPNSFQTEVLIWSESGSLLNGSALGNRLTELKNIVFESKKTNRIETIQVKNTAGQVMNFRSWTTKVSAGSVYYVQLLTNTNQLEATSSFFQKIIISCMLVFWLLSIVLSYYLAKKNMEPVMRAWQKQQEFVENSSHELRTPLTIIQAKLEKLFTTPTHTIMTESEHIALALNETRRLRQLTNDLLLLARTDSNELITDLQPINLEPFITALCEPYEEIAASQSKTVQLAIETKKQLLIDQKLVKQLLIILIDNALKYTESGDTITIGVAISGKNWQLSVADTGIGIKTTEPNQLFERFYREDKARQRESGGNGLGLAIAKSIVELHEGTIKVTTNEPRGTIFTMNFPIK